MRRPRLLIFIAVSALLITGAVGGVLWARGQFRASLPPIDGTLRVAGLSAPVKVARDALGIPTIAGGSREDVARATGVLHAQDRFFQMDLARRRAAGELSALVGERALEADLQIRRHRFRSEAERALVSMDPAWHALLDAYTAGVNSGLASLGADPFEYLLLRQRPSPWLAEDSLLVVLSMFITLQDPDGVYETTLATMHDVLPKELAEFLAPIGTEWDSPVVGSALDVPPIPGPDVYNLRARRPARGQRPTPKGPTPKRSLPAGLEAKGYWGSWELGLGHWRSWPCLGPWP